MTDYKTKMHASPSLATAVLFLAFNRPDATRKVFDVIRQVIYL
jgi:hypothetical protein